MSSSPKLNIPVSNNTCQLSIIDTTCNITCPTHYLIEPKVAGYDWLNLPTFSFYIKHEKSGAELLFDLGSRKDWQNSVPQIAKLVNDHVNGLKVDKDVLDIVQEGGVNVANIEALILSHWHYDHCGNLAALSKKTKVLVGPGFRDAFLPGYPSKEDSPFHEADFAGRDVVEVPFSNDLKIGRFQAHDYFGDGSLYVLNVPGHAIGHISALVRTTPDTFVFLGGDVCHFTGVIRPTKHIPLPDEIPAEAVLDRFIARPCPCSAFLSSHPDPKNGQKTPFFTISTAPETFYADIPTSRNSIQALQEFDADPNVLVAIAHDPTEREVFEFFPQATMNDWKAKGWKEAVHWGFLSELPYNGKLVRGHLVDGLYKKGQKIRGLQGEK